MNCCLHCRKRKVKCDGEQPVCGACRRSRLNLTCVYGVPVKGGKVLNKGTACLTCRNKKRRCDGARPSCGPCKRPYQKSSYKKEPCVYSEGDSTDPVLEICDLTQECAPSTSALPSRTNELPSSAHASADGGHSCCGLMQNPSSSALQLRMKGLPTTPREIPHFPPYSLRSTKNVYPSLADILSHLTVIDTGAFTIEDIDNPSRSALSRVSLDDLNMIFRFLSIAHRLTYGVYLPSAKHQALVRGDLSGAVIHKFFVHFTHVFGCHLYQERIGRYFLTTLEAKHLHLTLEAFSSLKEDDDPLTFTQACWSLCVLYQWAGAARLSNHYFKRCMQVIRKRDIRFAPLSDSTIPEFTEYVHERAAVLAQMVSSEAWFYIAGQAGVEGLLDRHIAKFEIPQLYSELYIESDSVGRSRSLEDQFRYELPFTYPVLFEICPIMLRVRSMVLAKDADGLIAWFHQRSIPSSSWFSTCEVFLSHLTAHLGDLKSKLVGCIEKDDEEGSRALRYNSILSSTTLAQISFTLAGDPASPRPLRAMFKRQCNEALFRVLQLVEYLSPIEFQDMELFMGVYWTRAIGVFTLKWPPKPTTTTLREEYPETSMADAEFSNSMQTLNYELDANIARLQLLNHQFITRHFLPGPGTLLDKLVVQACNN